MSDAGVVVAPLGLLRAEVVDRSQRRARDGSFGVGGEARDAESVTIARPSRDSRMLPGFTSRWTIPRTWATPSARATSRPIRAASPEASRPPRRSRAARSSPSISSMTRYGWPSSVPVSRQATMFRWRRTVAARASRRKRIAMSASSMTSRRSSLTATNRPSRVSSARWTVAIPPVPMTSARRYRPSTIRPALGASGSVDAGAAGVAWSAGTPGSLGSVTRRR